MFEKFCQDERGTLAPVFVIASLPILGAVAMAVDYSAISMKASQLQNSLDATGLAIGTLYYSGMTKTELHQLGEHFLDANLNGSAPASGADLEFTDHISALEVNATASGQDHIIKVRSKTSHEGMMADQDTLSAWRESYVRISPGPPACALALDPLASQAFKIDGSAQVRFMAA